jgi:hypothetical protein
MVHAEDRRPMTIQEVHGSQDGSIPTQAHHKIKVANGGTPVEAGSI